MNIKLTVKIALIGFILTTAHASATFAYEENWETTKRGACNLASATKDALYLSANTTFNTWMLAKSATEVTFGIGECLYAGVHNGCGTALEYDDGFMNNGTAWATGGGRNMKYGVDDIRAVIANTSNTFGYFFNAGRKLLVGSAQFTFGATLLTLKGSADATRLSYSGLRYIWRNRPGQ